MPVAQYGTQGEIEHCDSEIAEIVLATSLGFGDLWAVSAEDFPGLCEESIQTCESLAGNAAIQRGHGNPCDKFYVEFPCSTSFGIVWFPSASDGKYFRSNLTSTRLGGCI